MLAPLGIERVPSKYEKWAAWQRPGEAPKLWVGFPYNRLPASWGNGWMAALSAPTRAGVDAAYAAAMDEVVDMTSEDPGCALTSRPTTTPPMSVTPCSRFAIRADAIACSGTGLARARVNGVFVSVVESLIV